VTKTYDVYITASAEQDIHDIWNYICDDSKLRAKRFIGQIETDIAKLKKYPQLCPVIKETDLLGIEYRHLIMGNYRIIFRIDAENVYIMRIIHSSRILKF
jgi:plasmid stabilization system protein ParE